MKKLTLPFTICFLLFILLTSVGAQEEVASPLVRDLESMERILYGSAQPGSVLSRIEKIERDLIGDTLGGTLMERVNTLKTFILTGTEAEPSLDFKIKAIRLTLRSEPAENGILIAELEELEELIFGAVSNDPIGVRVDRLYKTCVDTSKVKSFTVQVPEGTLVKVSIQREINSERNNEGDPVPFVVVEDVNVDGVLVLTEGTRGEGRLTKVKRKGAFGKGGSLEIDFGTVRATDGTPVPLGLGKKSIEENKAVGYAVITSIAGLALLGPLGAVAGVFIQGEPAKVERGAELFLEMLEDKEIAGPLVGETEEAVLFRPRERETLEYEEVWEEEIPQEEIQEEIEEFPQEEPITWEEPEVEVEIRPYEEWE
ncbi:MAG TPA: hypothetical protein PLJ96_02840 [Candidatus Atribacteria bacterium]|nr:hypothetical protein [Candidatus Atribacteria bacterium]